MTAIILCAVCACLTPARTARAAASSIDDYNVVFESPCKDYHGAMPLGNGDIGISAWVEENGDLLFYIGKTDAYDDNNRLLKLGLVRVKLTPSLVTPGVPYRQELMVGSGEFIVKAGKPGEDTTIRLWVDANQPVIHVDVQSKRLLITRVSFETWRTKERKIEGQELAMGFGDPIRPDYNNVPSPLPAIQYPDTILSNQKNRIVWYHHNTRSAWSATMKNQGLQTVMNGNLDPLLDRIFGAVIAAKEMVSESDTLLKSTTPRLEHKIEICVMTQLRSKPQWWKTVLEGAIAKSEKVDPQKALEAHRKWWRDFWNRSWINVSGAPDAQSTTQGYVLQRYLTICGGRGNAPLKFNGSIFTLPREYDADYRRWGGAIWFQNTRLLYWPMLAAGDFDAMQPFFRTYLSALPLAKMRTSIYYNHDGAFFPETMYAWGAYSSVDYGWNRDKEPIGFATNPYIRSYWSGGLELSTMMLEYYAYSQDKKFATDILLPLASDIVKFYDKHYKRDANGKIRFEPAQSLETWHTALNPLPEIAGLKCVLTRLLELPGNLTTAAQRSEWKRMLGELPELPTKTEGGKAYLLPAESFSNSMNAENPELYAVFPYGLFGVGRDDLEIGRETYARRRNPGNNCWWQDDIHSAYLGMAGEARSKVAGRFANKNADFRFPGTYGPGLDELPDMDHGGVGRIALQSMLMQPVGDKILLFPAWPKEWNVEFKLHAPRQTIIEGVYRNGKVEQLKVVPASRAKDVVKMDPQ